MTAYVKYWSITDVGEVRTDSTGITTTYYRLIAMMDSTTFSLDEALSGNMTALQVGLPKFQRFQPHPNAKAYGTETTLYVSEFQAVQKKHSVWWDIMVTYTNDLVANPLLVPAVIGPVKTFTIAGGTLVDYQGNAILNTAGEPPEPFDKPERVLQIQIIKNVAATLQSWFFAYEDCTNSAPVSLPDGNVCGPRTLLISSIELSAIQQQALTSYRVATTEVLFRPSTWDVVFPSRGFNQLVTQREISGVSSSGPPTYTTVTNLTPILIKGEVPTEPQFLDKNGKWIKNPTPSQVVLLTAQLQTPVDFSQFPLS